MKVLMITRTVAEFANQQHKIREISKLGIALTVVSPPRWAGSDNEVRRVKPDGFELLIRKCWFSSTRSVRLGNHLHFYPSIHEVVGREKWDLVHIDEEPFNLATFHALRACKEHRRSAIFTTWQNLMKAYPPPFNLFERYVLSNAAGALAGNEEGLALLRSRGFHRPAAHIPQLGVDPVLFRRRNCDPLRMSLLPSGAFAIGFVGRLSPEKGVDILIKALPLLPSRCAVVLVGSGPERTGLIRLARELGVLDRVRWVPWVSSDEVADYMNTLDVLVLPSRTCNVKEQFGRVLIEAMSCGKCVVGSDIGEIPAVIGSAGLIFREGDERGLANCLERIMNDRLLRRSLEDRGRERILAKFTYSKIAADTADFYRQICTVSASADRACRENITQRSIT